MFKVGDEVFIKAEITDVSGYECSERPYFVAPDIYSVNWVSEDKIIPIDKTYADGLNDAWELAKKIYDTTHADRNKIFGMDNSCNGIKNVFEMFTPEEALAKIEAYEKEKSVCVGDVVIIDDDVNALVVDEISEESVFVLTENGCIETRTKKYLEKTDKKIPISGLLRQIGE